jgi:hypothetical protein
MWLGFGELQERRVYEESGGGVGGDLVLVPYIEPQGHSHS